MKVVHLGLLSVRLFVRVCNSKTIAPIGLIFLHKNRASALF